MWRGGRSRHQKRTQKKTRSGVSNSLLLLHVSFFGMQHLLSRRQLQQATATLQSLRPQLEAEVGAAAQVPPPVHHHSNSDTLAFWQSSPRGAKSSSIASAGAASSAPVSPFQQCLTALFGARCSQDGVRELTAAVLSWNVLGVQLLGVLRAERASRSKSDAHASTLKEHVRTLALELASTKRDQTAALKRVEELESSARHAAAHHATTVRRMQDQHDNSDKCWQREMHALQQQLHTQQHRFGRTQTDHSADLRDAAPPPLSAPSSIASDQREIFLQHRQHHPPSHTVSHRGMSASAASEEKQTNVSASSVADRSTAEPAHGSHSPSGRAHSKLRSSLLGSAPTFGAAELIEADEQSTPVVAGAGAGSGLGPAAVGGRGHRSRNRALRQSRTFASHAEQRLAQSNAILRSGAQDVKRLARSSTVLPASAQALFGATAPLRPQPPPSR